MEQLLKDNPLMVVSIVMMLVWFIFTCIRTYFPKEKLYIAEMIVLFINIVGNIYLAYVSAVGSETLEHCMIFAAWAAMCLGLLVIVFKEFYKKFYMEDIDE